MSDDYIYLDRFMWNKNKAKINLEIHKVSFELACRIFNDPALYVLLDDGNSTPEEDRFVCIGNIGDGVTILSVAMTERQPYIRIISARKATRKERSKYEKNAKTVFYD